MKVVTCADKRPTASYFLYDEFLASLKRHGHEPLILGWGEPWRGLGAKPRLLKAAIDSGRIDDEKIIFADCFDVIFVGAPEVAVELGEEFFGGDLVFNAEKSCFPDQSLAEKHPHTQTPYRFLNSGFSVGRTSDFSELLDWMKADEIPDDSRGPNGEGIHPNDQDYFMRAFVSGELPMRLDNHAVICQTLCGVTAPELEFLEQPTDSGTWPVALHANGNAKDSGVMTPILKALGYR